MNRRLFIRNTSLAAAATGFSVHGMAFENSLRKPAKLQFGICTDLHYDIMPDGLERIRAFVDAMNKANADFIIQLGDFCKCYDDNRPLLEEWMKFDGPGYHVIGNHDTDGGFNGDQVVQFWKSDGRYYAFDINGYHFIVLDGNEGQRSDCRRYPSTFTTDQLDWLTADLAGTSLPVVVFVHQPLNSDTGVENAAVVRYVLESAMLSDGTKKVRLVFSGHDHRDYYDCINGIHYVEVNSMSNTFLGKQFMADSFDAATLERIPKLREVAPYRDPLWAMVSIDFDRSVAITGRNSEFIGPSPLERGMEKYAALHREPRVSDRRLQL